MTSTLQRLSVNFCNFVVMLKQATHILMYLAVAITLAHSVVPHQHGEAVEGTSITKVSERSANSLTNWLEDLFDMDLGEHHLDKFQTARASDGAAPLFFLKAEVTVLQADFILLEVSRNFILPVDTPWPDDGFRRYHSLRAPPLQVS